MIKMVEPKAATAYDKMFKDIEMVKIQYDDMFKWVKEIFMKTGMDDEDASYTTENLVRTDLRSVYSHGIMRVPMYFRRLKNGCTSPTGKPKIIKDFGATAIINGNNAMGQVVGVHAMKLAIEKAKKYGVGYISVGQSNHYGACAHFSMMALPEDMIGITATMGSTRNIAPWGGTEPLLGNNPFSIAIPALNRDPIIMDMSNSVVARGKIVMAMKTKQPIPDSWAFGKDGEPTTDATEGYWGTLRPVGDYKGYGLTVISGMLSALLSGSTFGREVNDLYEEFKVQNVGHFMQVINISAFEDPVVFKKNVDLLSNELKESPKKDGVNEIYLPGELEAIAERRQKIEGISYPMDVINELRDLSIQIGVKPLL